MNILNQEEVLKLLGDPVAVSEGVRAFGKTARAFSAKRTQLLAKYPKRWVAMFDGNVIADGSSADEALAAVDQAGYRRESVLLRFIDRTVNKLTV